jgi:DNA-binding beta-propeller fold protein YncE
MTRWFALALLLATVYAGAGGLADATSEPQSESHRSPADVAVLPDGGRALTATHTSDSISLLDLSAGKVLVEQPCGHKPAGIACSRDGRRAAVSNLWSGTVMLLDIGEHTLRPVATAAVGPLPRGIVFAPDGGSVYVAVAGAHEVVQLDWQTRQIVRRWPAPSEPRRVALTRDGRCLAAVSGRSAQVRGWETQTGKLLWERTIDNAFNVHGLSWAPDDQQMVVAHLHDRRHGISEQNVVEGWALDNRLTRLTREPDAKTEFWQIALDVRGKAVGDPCGLAFSQDGAWLALAAAGTHELLIFRNAIVPWNSGDPGDFIEAALAVDDAKLRRVPLGGRPMAVQFAGATNQAVVANYLLDAVQVVDAKSGEVVRTIPLGGPPQQSLARQGEAIFHDALRSRHQWFSCHTCHVDGHTSARNFDTLNDGSFGNPKLTPSLRGVTHTGPWTWHGWQTDLGRAVEKSLTDTMFGPKPTAHDVKAVLAYLATLDHPPNPQRQSNGALTPAAERGQSVFRGKAHCSHCHQGEYYTSTKNYDVKIEPDGSDYDLWNPPSLRSLWDRGPYLHDGRADTLEELLTVHHTPEKLGGQVLTAEERADLIAFLNSL